MYSLGCILSNCFSASNDAIGLRRFAAVYFLLPVRLSLVPSSDSVASDAACVSTLAGRVIRAIVYRFLICAAGGFTRSCHSGRKTMSASAPGAETGVVHLLSRNMLSAVAFVLVAHSMRVRVVTVWIENHVVAFVL